MEKMGKWSLKHVETNQDVDQIVDFARETEEHTYFFVFSRREIVISDNIWDFNQKTCGVRNKNKNHVIQRQWQWEKLGFRDVSEWSSRPLEAAFWLLIFWFNLHFSSFFLVKMHQILLRLFPRKLGLFSLHSTASSSGQVAVKMVDKVQFWFPELDALDKKQTVPNPLYPGKKHTGFLEVSLEPMLGMFPWTNDR